MKIYFAGSIRGGREDQKLYGSLIKFLLDFGTVLTEHIGDDNLASEGEKEKTDLEIHDRDLDWLFSANVMVAEVTTPSLGVGYEIGRAIEKDIPILCLFRPDKGKKLSAMIAGSPHVNLVEYDSISDAKDYIKTFFSIL